MVSPTVQQIAQQNDQFRQGDPNVPGTIVVTAGMDHLLQRLDIPIAQLAQTVAGFADFTDDNDPHGEHDFGAFPFGDERCFWKIDYYDLDYKMGSDDPSNLSKTRRVLTIMLADEY